MTFGLKRLLLGVAVLLALPAHGLAELITFENRVIDRLDLAGPQMEGAFTYRATVGAGWEIQQIFGNPPSALVTFFNNERSIVGDRVEITLSGGGLFDFQSVDFRTILGDSSDRVTIIGFLEGVQTDTLVLNTSTTTFQTVASGFSGPVDTLRVLVTSEGNNAMILDNFNVTPTGDVIPEPSTLLLGAVGALGLFGYGWRRRTGVSAPSGGAEASEADLSRSSAEPCS